MGGGFRPPLPPKSHIILTSELRFRHSVKHNARIRELDRQCLLVETQSPARRDIGLTRLKASSWRTGGAGNREKTV